MPIAKPLVQLLRAPGSADRAAGFTGCQGLYSGSGTSGVYKSSGCKLREFELSVNTLELLLMHEGFRAVQVFRVLFEGRGGGFEVLSSESYE